ncbi:MAG TPA: hypothetical protein VEX43_10045 [Chthoniobacterales bacterium]|nr:hypothetical protein [Chthoniobacterales bacterium]
MSEQMPSNSEREAPGDLFRNVEETLKQLRSAATTAPPESWLKKTLSSSSDQNEFNVSVVKVLSQLFSALRETAANQEKRLGQLAEELRELRSLSENLDAFRAHSDGVASELRSVAANVRGLQERAAALEAELAQERESQGERIQHLLDEQRVCIRQLSLQASEEAVLADRARRAAELKLDELARRVPPPPA